MKRPVQLSIGGERDRPVGPLIHSVIATPTNAELIQQIAPLYLTGHVADVTYGRGGWWKRWRPDHLTVHDLAVDGVDFRELPHDDATFDAVCFDPPYIPQGGVETSTMADFIDRYGLVHTRHPDEVNGLLVAGMAEACRVTRPGGFVLVKLCDYTSGSELHSGLVAAFAALEGLPGRLHDLIVHASGTGPGGHRTFTQVRTRRAHSYLLVVRRLTGKGRGKGRRPVEVPA